MRSLLEKACLTMNFPSASKFYNIICMGTWFNPSAYADAVREHRMEERKQFAEQKDQFFSGLLRQGRQTEGQEAYKFANATLKSPTTLLPAPDSMSLQGRAFYHLKQTIQFYSEGLQRAFSQFNQLLSNPSRLWQNQSVMAWVVSILAQNKKELQTGKPSTEKDLDTVNALEETFFQQTQQPKLFDTKKVSAAKGSMGMS
jgi:hypothetical protein